MAIMQLKNVNKYYKTTDGNKFHALKNVNLSFEKGELVSIIGESGSGKSTLMNLLGGLDSSFDGEILVKGENIGEYKEKQLVSFRKERVGFVFQSFNLVSHLSILDNVTLAMTLSNVTKKEREERAKEILKLVGLEDHLTKKPDAISGGQKQRVAIARALVNDPDIIIADEPTGSLDSQTTNQVLDLIREIAERGKLVIMVTHSEKVAASSSRVIRIDDGKVVADETGIALTSNEKGVPKPEKITESSKNLSLYGASKLAGKNMWAKRGRNTLISLGSSIGIMSVILMLGLGDGVNTYLTDTMNANVDPTVVEVNMPPKEIDPEDPNMFISMMEPNFFEESNLSELGKVKHVEKVDVGFSDFSFSGSSVKYGDNVSTFMTLQTVTPTIKDEDLLSGKLPTEESDEVVITRNMATSLIGENMDDILGKDIEMTVHVADSKVVVPLTVSGVYEPLTPAESIVYVDYTDLQQVVEENEKELKPTSVYLTANDPENRQSVKEDIEGLGYMGSAMESLVSTFTEMLDIFTYILSSVAGISLLVSAIMILTVLYISVVERTKEIGVMKAIGARNKDIKRIFTAESFLIGLSSGLFGVGIAQALATVANSISLSLFDVTIVLISFEFAMFGILASILISMVAGVYPAAKASKLDPIEALRRE